MSDVTLGVDLSDLIARLAVVDGAGKVIERGIVSSNRNAAIKDAAKKALQSAGKRVGAIGVALPAATDTVSEDMTSALASATAAATPIRAIAAGTAAAVAEYRAGAAIGVKQLITFSIAEHVTAGVLVNGKPWRGAHGLASSVGWLAMNPV